MRRFLRLFFTFHFSLFVCLCNAQYTTLLTFTGTNGEFPLGGLILSGNILYGMTGGGGASGDIYGNVFSIHTDGTNFKQLFVFNGTNGEIPEDGSLILSGNMLYGATTGGNITAGNIFAVDTNGNNFKDLLDFNDTDGYSPGGTLTLSGNILYGLAYSGAKYNGGCVFSIHTDGTAYKDMYDFAGTNGFGPQGGLLLLGNILYGMTTYGGANGDGCIFSIDTNGNRYSDLFDFNGTDGAGPFGNLTFYGNKFYGMTTGGIIPTIYGNIFSVDTNGSNYRDIFDFNGTDGEEPFGTLLYASGVLYGTAQHGGKYGGYSAEGGVLFSIDTDGANYKDLFDFYGIYGWQPGASLCLSGNILYGVTGDSGKYYQGLIFAYKDTNGGLGVNELKTENEDLRVYPNPNNGNFTLSLSNVGTTCTILIYNTLGQQVYQSSITANRTEINLSGQPQGVYLYRVITENGELVGQGKLVIQR